MFFRKRFSPKHIEIENPIVLPSQSTEIGESSHVDKETKSQNMFFLWFGIVVMVFILLSRCFYLQVARGGYFKEIAENNRIRSLVIKAPRGIIVDRNGDVLARNVASFDAVFVPADLPHDYNTKVEIYGKLAETLGMNKANIQSMIDSAEQKSKDSLLIKENIGYDTALILEENYSALKGIYVDKTARREYVDGETFSSIIGYDGKITQEELKENPKYLMTDYIGKNGLEYTYEKYLHGVHGEHRVEVDSNGQIKEDLGIINPVAGDQLNLNIDAKLQKKSFEILSKILQENPDAEGASIVVIDPRDGAVRALVNAPSYNNNLFAQGISQSDYVSLTTNEKKPMLNRSVSGEYAPGSTFKPLIAAAALEEGVINESTTIDCHGNISIGSWSFPDWKTHGLTDVKKAIAESCDVFFYALGGGWDNIRALGMNTMAKYAKLFGLGEVTGIDLPWEAKGLVPTEEWKFKKFGEKWYVGDNYHCAIGQGYDTATPLQMALATATIANGGTLYRPRIVGSITSSKDGSKEELKPEIVRQNFVSRHNIEIVKEGMRQTILDGSGVQLKDLKVAVAGKTGTAQFGSEDKTHSWFVSFGPYENPEMAVAVLVEGGGEGHSWAVPAAKEIYKWYFDEKEGTVESK